MTRTVDAPMLHQLDATPKTVRWGYFDKSVAAAIAVSSGDLVRIRTLTHHAGDAPDLLMDEEIRALYEAVTDRGPGPHILTGPIYVDGAEPGDTLAVRILAAEPRLPYGSNLAAHWGQLYDVMDKERVTIYQLDVAAGLARAAFAYDWATSPLADAPGTIVEPGTTKREPALEGVAIPLRPHFGTMGVAPAETGRHSSVPPGDHGGNIDNWRIGPGATMHYPVQVPGALLSVGDPHVSQGDGEVSGTALECSLDGLLQLSVRADLGFTYPVLETATVWSVHGFGDDLDEAMRAASLRMLDLLGRLFGLSADDAYSLLSVACDFTVTQVVDQRQGVHATIDKRLFVGA
ncbi:MAG TPA: acetamidase/formamidase family protein [Mycobacteriales bacterium]|nr:acetamidase/formamidase family protein [Mycobacteriales bacterium]